MPTVIGEELAELHVEEVKRPFPLVIFIYNKIYWISFHPIGYHCIVYIITIEMMPSILTGNWD